MIIMKKIVCVKTKDPLYWREKCIDKILLNIPKKYREDVYIYYLVSIIFRTGTYEEAYDELIKELAKEFNIEIEIRDIEWTSG